MMRSRIVVVCMIVVATPLLTKGGDMEVFLDSSDGSSSFRIYDSETNELLRVESDGDVGIGVTNPVSGPAVEIGSNAGALCLPRLTTVERDALTPQAGMMIYNRDTSGFQGYVALTYGLDVSIDNTNNTGGWAISDIWSGGGSWTAGATGPLAKIDVYYRNSGGDMDTMLHIYDGDGISGTELHTQTVPFPDTSGADVWNSIGITGIVNVVTQHQYTAYFTATSGLMFIRSVSSNVYSGGQIWHGGNAQSSCDLVLRTYVEGVDGGGIWTNLY